MTNNRHFGWTAVCIRYCCFCLIAIVSIGLCTADETSIVNPVDVVCDSKFQVSDPSDQTDGSYLYVPYCSSHGRLLSGRTRKQYTEAMIIIHGHERNADKALSIIQHAATLFSASATRRSLMDDIAMIAPQFLTLDDIDALDLEQSDSRFLYWSSPGWKNGSASLKHVYGRPFTISSFAVMDQIIDHLISHFPNLEQITFIGNSAGGQFLQRYAAGSRHSHSSSDIRFSYIFSNLSSYTYFSSQRPELDDPTQFSVPRKSTHSFDKSECPTYNDYRYGLRRLNHYMNAVGTTQLSRNYYRHRNVILLIGEEDTKNNFVLDTSCSAMLQGENRYQRGIHFYNHIVDKWGDSIRERHNLAIVPGAGHDAAEMYQSACGQSILFGERDPDEISDYECITYQ